MAAWLVLLALLTHLALLEAAQLPGGVPRACLGQYPRALVRRANRSSALLDPLTPAHARALPVMGASAEDVIVRAHYAAVVAPTAGGRSPGKRAALFGEQLGTLAARSGHPSLALVYEDAQHAPTQYGHMWPFLRAVVALLDGRGRACARGSEGAPICALPELDIYLPLGVDKYERAFDELVGLFGNKPTRRRRGVRLQRAPWVPMCFGGCCAQFGGLPSALRGRVTLLTKLPVSGSPWWSAEDEALRAAAYELLGLGDVGNASAPPPTDARRAMDTVLYARSDGGSNSRRVLGEARLEARLREWAAREHPSLTFVGERPHALPSFADEVGLYARSALVVTLFGSALHNCVFMRPGALVVELHGALYDQWASFFFYHRRCRGAGVLHAPFYVEGATPRVVHEPGQRVRLEFGRNCTPTEASIDADELLRLLRRVFPAEGAEAATGRCVPWREVLTEYQAAARVLPNPFTGRPIRGAGYGRRSKGERVEPLPAVYTADAVHPACPDGDAGINASGDEASRNKRR